MIDYGFGARLAPLEPRHLEQARVWRNDWVIWQWCRQSNVISEPDQSDWYDRQRKDSTIKMYAIYPREQERFSGVCGLTSIDALNRRAEFSLYIGPDMQGAGLGKEALKCLLHHGFGNLNLHIIWGETFDGNPAANVFEKLGFKKEGTRRDFYFKNGKYIDAHLFSVKNEEVVWNG